MTRFLSTKSLLVILSGILAAASFAVLTISNSGTSADENSSDTTKTAPVSVFRPMLKPLVFEPKRIKIEKLGIDAPVVRVGVEEDGRLEVPEKWTDVGWYENGPRAGEEGNAILAGHYDRVGGAPAVFYKLVNLKPGDTVRIYDEVHKPVDFAVFEVTYVDIDDPSAVLKAYEETTDPILTIITCGGVWNVSTQDYTKRLLIKASRI